MGSFEIRTEYSYLTRFFLRDGNCRDTYVEILGSHLPLLEGHTVTAVIARNDWDEEVVCRSSTTTREVACTLPRGRDLSSI